MLVRRYHVLPSGGPIQSMTAASKYIAVVQPPVRSWGGFGPKLLTCPFGFRCRRVARNPSTRRCRPAAPPDRSFVASWSRHRPQPDDVRIAGVIYRGMYVAGVA